MLIFSDLKIGDYFRWSDPVGGYDYVYRFTGTMVNNSGYAVTAYSVVNGRLIEAHRGWFAKHNEPRDDLVMLTEDEVIMYALAR